MGQGRDRNQGGRGAEGIDASFGGRLRLWLCWWIAFYAGWFLLTATLAASEFIVGAAAAAISATAAEIVRVQDYRRFRPRLRWLKRIPKLPPRMITDSLAVFRALWQRKANADPRVGAFRAIPFDPGGADGVSAARRALILAAVTSCPNSYVIGIDDRRKIMLLHQYVPSTPENTHQDVLGWL
jgi:multisubunit Na+/H+ antiporter MnhE subunit